MQKKHESWDMVTKTNGYHKKLKSADKTDAKSKWVNKLIVWSCCPKTLFPGNAMLHDFHMWDCAPIQ